MPITVNYNPDIELLGETAFNTGQGMAYLRERQRLDALRAMEQQRQDQFRAQDINRFDQYNFDAMNRFDAEQSRAAQEYQAALARQQQQEQFMAEQDRLGLDSSRRYGLDLLQLEGVERQRQDEAGLRQQQRDYYIQSIEQKRQQQEAQEEQWRQEQAITTGGEWQLSESDQAQKDAELQRIQQYSEYMEAPDYEKAMDAHERKWRGKEKLVAPKKTPQQQVEESTYVQYVNGKAIVWHTDKDGSWRPTPIEQDSGEADKQMWEKQKFLFELAAKNKPLVNDPKLVEPYNQLMRNMAAQLGVPWQDIQAEGQEGTTQPPPEAQPAPEPTPEPTDTEAIWQTIPDQQKQQVVDLIQQIKVAMQSGDDVSAEQLKAQLADLYRQLGIMQ